MATTIEQTTIPTGTWKVDPTHSSVSFSVKHMVVATFRGAFHDYDVTLSDEEGQPRLAGTVGVPSVDVRDDQLKGHLLAPDFFDAERYPEIKFVSSEIREDGEGIVVDGELTVKGQTRKVEARGTITDPVENLGGRHGVGLSLETIVDRTEFGLDWNAPLPQGGVALGNDVTLHVDLELAKEDEQT